MTSSGSDDAFVPLARTNTIERKQDAIELLKRDPTLLRQLLQEDPDYRDQMKEVMEASEREERAAEIMKIDDEEITDQIQDVKKEFKELIANSLLKIVNGNTTRRFFIQDPENRDIALSKFEELNDFESSFRMLFVEPFNEVMTNFSQDFHNQFIGEYLSLHDDDDDDDDDDDYDEVLNSAGKRQKITPNKSRRPGMKQRTSMSPKIYFEDGQRVMVKVDATGKFEERIVGSSNQIGYITVRNAEKKHKEGKLRV